MRGEIIIKLIKYIIMHIITSIITPIITYIITFIITFIITCTRHISTLYNYKRRPTFRNILPQPDPGSARDYVPTETDRDFDPVSRHFVWRGKPSQVQTGCYQPQEERPYSNVPNHGVFLARIKCYAFMFNINILLMWRRSIIHFYGISLG